MLDIENLYTLYLDESGVGKPGFRDECEIFALGGILIRKPDEQDLIDKLSEFKSKWKVPQSVPLHACEIKSYKKNFRLLEDWKRSGDIQSIIDFKTDILKMVLSSNVLLHACVIHRDNYLGRYFKLYGRNTWNMLRSATSIVIERAARLVHQRSGKLYVVFERGNTGPNNVIRNAYKELRERGTPFNPTTSSRYQPLPAEILSATLFKNIEDKTKANPLLQIADSCLAPIVEPVRTGNTKTLDRLIAANRVIDCVVANPELEGIKYYCCAKTETPPD